MAAPPYFSATGKLTFRNRWAHGFRAEPALPRRSQPVFVGHTHLPLFALVRDRLGVAAWRLRSWQLYWKQTAARLLMAASIFALWLYLVR